MVYNKKDIKNLSIVKLKKLCKIYKINNYSKLKKNELLEKINNTIAVLFIQKNYRKRLMKYEIQLCPISMDIVSYPYFAFKPKGSSNFIYYNIKSLVDYLLITGDFRDPKTREPYKDETLLSIDRVIRSNGIKCKSVYNASTNKVFYKKIKNIEDEIIVLERCLDEIISSIVNIMENEMYNENPKFILNTYHFPAYIRYFKKLYQLCKFSANSQLKSTLTVFINNPGKSFRDHNKLQDFILQFIYTIESTHFDTE